METLLVLTEPGRVETQLKWATKLAAAWGSDRLIGLCCVMDVDSEPPEPVGEDVYRRGDFGLTGETHRAAKDLEGIAVEVMFMRDPDPAPVILDHMRNRDIHHLIIATNGLWPKQSPLTQLTDQLMRTSMCEAALLDTGRSGRCACAQITVPMRTPGCITALHAAAAIAQTEGATVSPLLVSSDFNEDARQVAGRELALDLLDAGISEDTDGIEPAVALADTFSQGVLRGGREADLILLAGLDGRRLRELRTTEQAFDPTHSAFSPVIIVYHKPKRKRLSLRTMRVAVKSWLPELALADRIALFERVQGGSRWNADFAIMIGLSAIIASLGLKIDSVPVIIGAMLVAPLMTPLIGAGLAMAQGNVILFRRSMAAMAYGILTGLALSILVGITTLKGDLPLEVAQRGQPHLLDLFVALASGIAAAYAFSRSAVAEAVAGVAIAAALVPPLAAVGLAISYYRFVVAEGAAILLVTNLAAIIIGAALTFNILGARGTRVRPRPSTWARRAVMGISLLLILLLAPLGMNLADQIRAGQARPMAFPLSRKIRGKLNDYVHSIEGLQIVLAGRSGVDDEFSVTVVLTSDKPVPQPTIDEIREIVSLGRIDPNRVAVTVLQSASIEKE